MALAEDDIKAVQGILTAWNPLGDRAATISDLRDYHTEAIDILTMLGFTGVIFRREPTATIVRTILEQAFNLDLRKSDCEDAGRKIDQVVRKGRAVEPADRGEPPDEPSFRAGM